MADDYYDILGVSRSASPEEIQKAYRRLARKHHPDLAEDKDKAKQEFQRVQNAYDVLSDAEKRQKYDQFGDNYDKMGGGNPFQGGGQMPPGMDMEKMFGGGAGGAGFEDIMRQMFGGAGGAAGAGRGGFGGAQTQAPPRPTKGQDVEKEIIVPFATSVNGGQHQLSLRRSNGSVENLTIKIPAGMTSGKKVRLRGQGHSLPTGGQRGDLLVKVKVAPHPVFERVGDNLQMTLPISIVEAVHGAKIDLPTPHGTITVTIPENSSSGKSLRLKGMGVKHDNGKAGDLVATLRIVLDEEMTADQKKAFDKFAAKLDGFDPRSELKW